MKFLHIADVHLGFEQYGERERFNDFSRTFMWLMDFANKENVDFVILAGDLFHKRVVDPMAMRVAMEGFGSLSCRTFAIEGNHEKAFFSDQKSWVDFLGEMGLFTLVNGESVYTDEARICGIRYAGSGTDAEVRRLAETIPSDDMFTIMMIHAGVEGQLSHAGSLKTETVDEMGNINYVALGHIHKPYIIGKAYNPGSPETVSADESLWPRRGALLVTVDNDDISHQVIVPPRRPFHRFDIGFNGCEDPKKLYEAMEYITSLDINDGAVIDVILTGQTQFPRSDLDIKGAQGILSALSPLVSHVRNETTPVGFNLSIDSSIDGIDTERVVLERVIERDARYRDTAITWVDRAVAVKNMSLVSPPEAVVDYLEAL